jgi:hypothetical protein
VSDRVAADAFCCNTCLALGLGIKYALHLTSLPLPPLSWALQEAAAPPAPEGRHEPEMARIAVLGPGAGAGAEPTTPARPTEALPAPRAAPMEAAAAAEIKPAAAAAAPAAGAAPGVKVRGTAKCTVLCLRLLLQCILVCACAPASCTGLNAPTAAGAASAEEGAGTLAQV